MYYQLLWNFGPKKHNEGINVARLPISSPAVDSSYFDLDIMDPLMFDVARAQKTRTSCVW